MRHLLKYWTNQEQCRVDIRKFNGWTRGVHFYDGPTVQLVFQDRDGTEKRIYGTPEDAQKDYDAFKLGNLTVAKLRGGSR